MFNSKCTWGSRYKRLNFWGKTVYDVQTVTLHELGHALGLLDQYGTPDLEKTMGRSAKHTGRSLTTADIAGLHYLYGSLH